jgi:hypothetical protein
MSLPARLFNVLATPGEVFEYLKSARVSTANWLVPALLAIVVSWLGAWVVFSQDSIQQQLREITDQAIEKQIQKQHLSDQQAEQARLIGGKFGAIGTKIAASAAPVFIAMIIPFWWGLLLWLIGTKAFKADFSYMKAVEVTGLSGMVGVLDSILRSLLILIMGNLFASPSLALLIKQFDPQNPVHGLLAAINIMSFWALALRALGLARLSGVGFGRAAVWVFGTWALLTGVFSGFGFAMQKMFAR